MCAWLPFKSHRNEARQAELKELVTNHWKVIIYCFILVLVWVFSILTPLCLACRAGLGSQVSRRRHRWWSPAPSVWPWSTWCSLPAVGSVWYLQLKRVHRQIYMSEGQTTNVSTVFPLCPAGRDSCCAVVADVVQVFSAASSESYTSILAVSASATNLLMIATQL